MQPSRLSLALGAVLASAALGLLATPAQAGVTFSTTGGGNPDENVLLQTGVTGNPLFGVTNQTGASVRFETDPGVSMSVQGVGQARIERAGGGNLSTICILLADQTFDYFTEAKFNIDAFANGSVLLEAFSGSGGTSLVGNETLSLGGSGSNFFRVTATGDTQLTKIRMTAADNIVSLAQVRLGGVTDLGDPGDGDGDGDGGGDVVPEPGSMALLAGGILPIAGFLRRRRTARARG